jgi:hypothetical protein
MLVEHYILKLKKHGPNIKCRSSYLNSGFQINPAVRMKNTSTTLYAFIRGTDNSIGSLSAHGFIFSVICLFKSIFFFWKIVLIEIRFLKN